MNTVVWPARVIKRDGVFCLRERSREPLLDSLRQKGSVPVEFPGVGPRPSVAACPTAYDGRRESLQIVRNKPVAFEASAYSDLRVLVVVITKAQFARS